MENQYEKLSETEEAIGKAIVNAAFKIHKKLGPGLLERVYEVCMEHELKKEGFNVKRQVDIRGCLKRPTAFFGSQ
jgi:GxxExxY protein